MTDYSEIERWRGEVMGDIYKRLLAWQESPVDEPFTLDIEEVCEVLQPLLEAALRIRPEAT